MMSSRLLTPFLFALLCLASPSSAAERTVAYEWNTVATYESRQGNTGGPWQFELVEKGLLVTMPPTVQKAGYYNYFLATPGTLVGGHKYTAEVTFEIAKPTLYPGRFYMFARNTDGNQHDIWQTWIGEPGRTRTLSLPLDLPKIAGGEWNFYLGVQGPGAIIVKSLVIYDGITTAAIPPVLNAPLASTLPPGVAPTQGYKPFTPEPPVVAKPLTLSMANYEFVADSKEAAANNSLQFLQAIKDCRARNATTLLIPKGTYRFAGVRSIPFDSLKDITIDGQGSLFIIQEMMRDGAAFLVRNCERMVIKDLTIDWDWNTTPIASLGVVSNLSDDRKQCDFTFPDLDAAQTALTKTTPWKAMIRMDPKTLVRDDNNVYNLPRNLVVAAGPAGNVLRVTFPSAAPVENGRTYAIRHLYYEMCAFKVGDSGHLVFDSVTVNSIPGMGWLFTGAMHHFALINCHIIRPEGSRRALTTAADGVHVGESMGNMIIKDCSFTGMGDDAINLHDNCYQAEAVTDPSDPARLTLLNCRTYTLRITPGDSLQFYDPDYANLNRAAEPVVREVATVQSDNAAGRTELTFTTPLPSPLTPQAIIRNTRYQTRNVLIDNCTFEYTSGRGILLSTYDTTLQNCRFDHVFGAPIRFETNITQPHWSEGHGCADVLIRDNVFENCNLADNSKGAIIWGGVIIPWGPTGLPLFRNVTIENNRFINAPGPAVLMSNTANVIVRDNRIETTREMANATDYSGTLFFSNSSGLALGGNGWLNTAGTPAAGGVVYDPADTTNIDATGNASRIAPASRTNARP